MTYLKNKLSRENLPHLAAVIFDVSSDKKCVHRLHRQPASYINSANSISPNITVRRGVNCYLSSYTLAPGRRSALQIPPSELAIATPWPLGYGLKGPLRNVEAIYSVLSIWGLPWLRLNPWCSKKNKHT